LNFEFGKSTINKCKYKAVVSDFNEVRE